MNDNNTTELVRSEVWLLGKCSLCGYLPLERSERDGYGKIWHYHVPIDNTGQDDHE